MNNPYKNSVLCLDIDFARLLEQWVSGNDQERAVILRKLKGYGERLEGQLAHVFYVLHSWDAAYLFLRDCDDAEIVQVALSRTRQLCASYPDRGYKFSGLEFRSNVITSFYLSIVLTLNIHANFFLCLALIFLGTVAFNVILHFFIDVPMIKRLRKEYGLDDLEDIFFKKEDPRVLGVACTLMLLKRSTKQYSAHWDRLERLLPQITEAHKPFFQQEDTFSMLILARIMPDYISLLLLQALERVGDTSLLPALRRLSRTTKSPTVAEAALHCIATLQSANDLALEPATLLRASNATEQTDTLLRPAQHTNDEDTNQLLRPR